MVASVHFQLHLLTSSHGCCSGSPARFSVMNDQYQTPGQGARPDADNMYGRVPQRPLPLESVYPAWLGGLQAQHQYHAPEPTGQAFAFDTGQLNMDVRMPFSFAGLPYLIPLADSPGPTVLPGSLDLSLLSVDPILPIGPGDGIPGYALESQPPQALSGLEQIVFDPTAVPLPLDQYFLNGSDPSLVLDRPAEKSDPGAYQRVTCVGCQLVVSMDDISKHVGCHEQQRPIHN